MIKAIITNSPFQEALRFGQTITVLERYGVDTYRVVADGDSQAFLLYSWEFVFCAYAYDYSKRAPYKLNPKYS